MFDEKTEELPESMGAVGSAVLAGDKLQAQLDNKSMVVRRMPTTSLGLNLLRYLFLCFAGSLIGAGIMSVFSLERYFPYFFVLSFLVTSFILYKTLWNDGNNDSTFVLFNNLPRARFRGVLAGIIVAIPSIIGSVLLLIAVHYNSQGIYAVFQWINYPFNIFILIFNRSGFLADINLLGIVLLAAIPLYIIFMTSLGYFLGFRKVGALNIRRQIRLASKRSI